MKKISPASGLRTMIGRLRNPFPFNADTFPLDLESTQRLQHLEIPLAKVKLGELMLLYEYASLGALSNYLKMHRGVWFYNHVSPNGELLSYNSEMADELQQVAIRNVQETEMDGFDGQLLSTRDLLRIAYHISQGVAYLHSRSIIHRDLSANNVMICNGHVAKIAGFGMAKQTRRYVALDTQETLCDRWMAPESITDRTFSAESDMWTLGVLMWELFSLSCLPYEELVENPYPNWPTLLQNGLRLGRPEACPGAM
ncbi:fibroblast growth factor receptor 1-A-like [Paramacrobiotus metropolitanus]|uniref:fibroblast growth factor receptor 1-A-like n=1 Tax=Paramacrobiotus metropolitanus TaxID=2943436 RepID=UPI00244623CD|nr:fibroblast growth factor receptor 1-A-like [Paramacrobiotus metropolitanus]